MSTFVIYIYSIQYTEMRVIISVYCIMLAYVGMNLASKIGPRPVCVHF